jgi:bacterioferritin
MKGEERVLDYLDRSLRNELTAINQYWLHFRVLDNWGYKGSREKVARRID